MVKVKTAIKEGNRQTILYFELCIRMRPGVPFRYAYFIHMIFKEETEVHGDSIQGAEQSLVTLIYFCSVYGLGKGWKQCFL